MKKTRGQIMTAPSLRKLENDLEVNKTTLHNWKTNRPKLYEFIIESYKDREMLKQNLEYLIEQKKLIENEINVTQERVS
jgi:hypothetical protein